MGVGSGIEKDQDMLMHVPVHQNELHHSVLLTCTNNKKDLPEVCKL